MLKSNQYFKFVVFIIINVYVCVRARACARVHVMSGCGHVCYEHLRGVSFLFPPLFGV